MLNCVSATINVPMEYLDVIKHIITKGIQHAELDINPKKELTAWWEVEQEFMEDEIIKNES